MYTGKTTYIRAILTILMAVVLTTRMISKDTHISSRAGTPACQSSPHTAGDTSHVVHLPYRGTVELTALISTFIEDMVELRWKTTYERGNLGFEILRSVKLPKWESVGYVRGRGEGDTPQEYYFVDFLSYKVLTHEELHYRLRQIDRDGEEQFSPVVTVNTRFISGTSQLFQNYPNPFNPDTEISFSLPARQHVSLIIYDLLGNEMERILDHAKLDEGFHSVSYSANALPNGMYVYTLITQTGRYSRTMEVVR